MWPMARLRSTLSEREPNAENIQNTVFWCAFAEKGCDASVVQICHSNTSCLLFWKPPGSNMHSFPHTIPNIAAKSGSSALGGSTAAPMVQLPPPVDPGGIKTLAYMLDV